VSWSGPTNVLSGCSGNYARSFQLSSKIDQDRISAELRDGVMTLVLPKSERAKPRKIAVS
jgi:HSP20 family protein